MDKERLIIDENQLSYDEVVRIKEHAKQYDSVSDKKEFLRNAGAYEQKVILLNSIRPYEVLNYLSELELETSKIILESLKYEEIEKILELFSLEDKKRFYETFSDLSLVNEFIAIDENAKEHVKNLDFDRKVELIDSSTIKTAEASEIIYESMPYIEREEVSNLVTNANASVALSASDIYNNDAKISEIVENNNINVEDIKVETPQELEQKVEQEIEKQEIEQKDKMLEQVNREKTDFLKLVLQNYVKTNPEFANLINNPEITYEMLPDNLKLIVDNDFEKAKEQEKNKLEEPEKQEESVEVNKELETKDENQTKLEEFQNAKVECEQNEIEQIKNVIQSKELEVEIQKTL